MEKWNIEKIQLALLNPHHSIIPTFHYPNITFYINFASSRQQKRSDHDNAIVIVFYPPLPKGDKGDFKIIL
jgi:hypothetical protein